MERYLSLFPKGHYSDAWWCFANRMDGKQAESSIGSLIFVVIKDVLEKIDNKVIERLVGKTNVSCKQISFENNWMVVRDLIRNGKSSNTITKIKLLNLGKGKHKNIYKFNKENNDVLCNFFDKLKQAYRTNRVNYCNGINGLSILEDDIKWLKNHKLLHNNAIEIIKEYLSLGYMEVNYSDYKYKSDIDFIGEDKLGNLVYYEVKFLKPDFPRYFNSEYDDYPIYSFYIDFFQFATIGRIFEECRIASTHVVLKRERNEPQHICQFLKENEEKNLEWLYKEFKNIKRISEDVNKHFRNHTCSDPNNREYYVDKDLYENPKMWFTWGVKDEETGRLDYNYLKFK
ncbi:MAG: hypothetical protein J6F33_05560 [Acidaminococcaceae bacterium]|nr:hypothetical protein [Acidaminococcaceae bacterium]